METWMHEVDQGTWHHENTGTRVRFNPGHPSHLWLKSSLVHTPHTVPSQDPTEVFGHRRYAFLKIIFWLFHPYNANGGRENGACLRNSHSVEIFVCVGRSPAPSSLQGCFWKLSRSTVIQSDTVIVLAVHSRIRSHGVALHYRVLVSLITHV